MSVPTQISAVVITFNEEAHIAECLDSLKGVADEVVVVDSFSTDATVAICKERGAKIIQRAWEGYAETKNFGHSQAQFTTILSIDADEVLSDQLRTSILDLKLKDNTQRAFAMNRLNNYCGQWMHYGGLYPDVKLRIFPKESKWEGAVHETLRLPENVTLAQLKGDLLHYSIANKQDHIAREKKYAQMAKPYSSFFRAFVSAVFRFVKVYVFHRGFLDGKLGLQYCYISSKAKMWRVG